MSKVTAITPQKKNADRVNLYLDGKFFCSLSTIVVAQQRLEEGSEVDAAKLDKIIFESDKRYAFDYALGYISKYVATQKKVSDKLYEKGFGKAVVEYTIQKLSDYGYVDDAEYAKQYVLTCKNVKGARRMREDLKSRGVQEKHIDEALKDLDNRESALVLAQKHSTGKDLSDQNYVGKLVRYLQYRGFDWDIISWCLSQLKNNN